MGDSSSDIIIKGGSCEIYFDDSAYERDPNDHKKRKHNGAKITRVTISGDSNFQDVDTGSHPGGFTGTIRVYCDND